MTMQDCQFKDYCIYFPKKWDYIIADTGNECLVYRDRKGYELLFRLTWLETKNCLKISSHWRLDYTINCQTKIVTIADIPEFIF